MKVIIISLFIIISCSQENLINNNNDSSIVKGKYLVESSSENFTEKLSEMKLNFFQVDSNIYEVQVQKNDEYKDLKEISEFIEPVYKVSIEKKPLDTKYLSLWGMKNLGQGINGASEGQFGSDIQAEEAWDLSVGSKEVVVAVIDTGIDYNHPDLKANMWINAAEKNGAPGVDDDGNGYVDDIHGFNFVSDKVDSDHYGRVGTPDPMDDQGHGTHCAGTIGAVGNNRLGVTGINWNVSLMAIKFLDENGSGTSTDQYRSLKYALDNEVDIISASYGGGGKSRLIKKMMDKLGEKGILFVAAAGNDNSDNDREKQFPASYESENILSVAATDNHDRLAYFSNYGESSVDLAAPGVGIMSTLPTSIVKKGYGIYSGTSMATPHVAGAAALLLSYDGSLRKKPIEIKERLMNNSDPIKSLIGKVKSSGRLNLFKSLKNKSSQTNISKWSEEFESLITISNPNERIIQVYEIERKGVKAIKLFVDSVVVDTSFDNISLYDKNFNKHYEFGEIDADFWTPAIPGDKVYVMFSNALVKTDTSNGNFGNFNTDGLIISKIKVAQ